MRLCWNNLIKSLAKEGLETDLLHMTSKEQNIRRIFTKFLCFSSLSHRSTTNAFAHVLAGSNESFQRIKFPLYTPRLFDRQREGLQVSNMKPFVFDSALVDSLDIARHDHLNRLSR